MTSTSMPSEVKPGDILSGKFEIERVLGQGGMGVVVQARHLQLERRVALKFLLPQGMKHPETVARFTREARALAKLRSEHVARVIDVGTLENGAPYIVMEYLEGQDLAERLAQSGAPPSLEETTTFILQACEALAEAHAAGIVHRDLKPANLFVSSYPDGTPCIKILDFGIAKLVDGTPNSGDFDMTRTAVIMGSPIYMSPEQMRSTRNVDPRTDIWSLGVILYEFVAGRVPFDAETLPQLCTQVLEAAPQPIEKLRGTGKSGLEAVILRCLEKEPVRRFQSVAELALALAPFAPADARRSVDRAARLSSGSSGSLAPKLQLGDTSAATSSDFSSSQLGLSTSASRPLRITIALVGVLLLIGVAWFLLGSPRPVEAPEANAGTAGTPSLTAVATPAGHVPTEPPKVAEPPSVAAPVAAPVASVAPEVPAHAPSKPLGKKPAAATAQVAPPAPTPAPKPATPPAPRPVNPLDGRL